MKLEHLSCRWATRAQAQPTARVLAAAAALPSSTAIATASTTSASFASNFSIGAAGNNVTAALLATLAMHHYDLLPYRITPKESRPASMSDMTTVTCPRSKSFAMDCTSFEADATPTGPVPDGRRLDMRRPARHVRPSF